MPKLPKVIVLMGGSSAEREISIKTGSQIYEALKSRGYPAETIDMSPKVVEDLQKADGDIVFIALHGSPGEDGTIQGLLDTLEIPYVGSGVLASALGMDKFRSKLFFAAIGIPSPFYMLIHKKELEKFSLDQMSDKLNDSIGLPLVIKPVREGSAIGVTIVKELENVKAAIEKGFKHGDELIAEECIIGTEITIGVIGNEDPRTLPIVEIISDNDFYDFEAKYEGKSRHIIPARISDEEAEKALKYSLAAHSGLGCQDLSRVDFIVSKEDGIPYLLEINTIPGMTPVSLFPDAAKAEGLEFPDLIDQLVRISLKKRKPLPDFMRINDL